MLIHSSCISSIFNVEEIKLLASSARYNIILPWDVINNYQAMFPVTINNISYMLNYDQFLGLMLANYFSHNHQVLLCGYLIKFTDIHRLTNRICRYFVTVDNVRYYFSSEDYIHGLNIIK